MKKSASSPPVSVRFLNSSSDDPAGSGDEGLGEEKCAQQEGEAAGDGQKVDAAPEATAGHPVPPPRRHSTKSKADEWRGALQDLSPVKELVSRFGKTRSSSFDATSRAAAAAAGQGKPEKPAEQKPASESDAWSRLTELTGKITKTVEGKISDYRGSARSGSVPPPDSEIVTESDVLESVRDASPPPPPSAAPAAADSLDVTFVNVPSPVSPPATSPGSGAASPPRRDFRLASIRPKIYERLQRHVARPAPAAAASAAPPDSVTLSALQDKYIDEEAVEEACEAFEVLPPPPPPAQSPETSDGRERERPAEDRVRPEAAGRREPDRRPAGLLAMLTGPDSGVSWAGWRWLLAVVAVLLAVPLPAFVSGLLLGCVVTAAAALRLYPLLRPSPRHLPPPPSVTGHRPPADECRPTLMHKDWMHELLVGPYEPNTHQPTEPRFVRLEGSMLRISHPKGHVPKRATFDEHVPNLPFVQQRIYNIAGCEVELQPEGLHPTRRWSRRYPLCVRLDNCRGVTRSMGLGPVPQRTGSTSSDRASDKHRTSDGEWDPGSDEAIPSGSERLLILFARTDRGKEHWYRLLVQATQRRDGLPPAPAEPAASSPDPAAASAASAAGSPAQEREDPAEDATVQPSPKLDFDYYMSKLMAPEFSPLPSPFHTPLRPSSFTPPRPPGLASPYRSAYGPVPKPCATPPPVRRRWSPAASPETRRLATPTPPDSGSDSRPPSPVNTPVATGHVVWFNALIGRLAFDVFGNRQWVEFVQRRIQKKLSRIKAPFFIEELEATSCDLGCVMPRVTSVSAPSCDERGLWLDMALVYEGGATMTLRTKVNLMKLGKSEKAEGEKSASADSSSTTDKVDSSTEESSSSKQDGCASYECDRNADDLISLDSSSDEDETDTYSASDGGSPPPPSSPSQPSSKVGRRLMQVVDKVTTSRYFQQAAQNRYVKRYMEEFSNTPLELTVTLRHLQGVLTVNIPRPPSDRLWYGFRGQPDIVLSAQPRLGTRDVTLTQVTDWIENKLIAEVHKMLILPNMDDLIVPLLAGETLDD